MKKKIIEIPLWERDLILLLGGSFQDILKIAKDYKMSMPVFNEINYDKLTPGDAHGGAYFCLEKGIGIAWFPTKRIPVSILAHEATHIVDWLMQFIGAEREMEARAYTVEWLVTNIPKALKKM